MAIDRNRIAQQAERLVVQGKVPEAIAQYELLVKDNPRDMNTINKIGDLYSRLGKKREAILQFNKIGEFYAKDGFFLKAIAIYKKVTKLDPSHLDTYQRLADLYAQQGLVLEARSQYEMVGEMYLKAGDPKKAAAVYQSLVRVDPENLKHRSHLADLLAKDGRAAESAEEYTKLGAELERRGHDEEARIAYQRASSIQPGSPAVVGRLATAQAAAGDLEGGIKAVKDALRKPGDHKDLLALLADFQIKAGQLADAGKTLALAIQAAPDRVDLKLRLARVQEAGGDASTAYDTLSPHLAHLARDHANEVVALLEAIGRSAQARVEPLVRLAELYAAHKKGSDAARCAHRALDLCIDRQEYAAGRNYAAALIRLCPDDPSLREKLTLLQTAEQTGQAGRESSRTAGSAAGDEAERAAAGRTASAAPGAAAFVPNPAAASELPAPLQLEPEDEDFIAEHMTEADVFVKYGLGDRAVEQLVTVVERYPGHVPALLKLKEIHLEEGNREGARQQMAALVKAHLSAGDDAAAAEALNELRRFDPNCRELAELSATFAPGTASAAPPLVAQAGMAYSDSDAAGAGLGNEGQPVGGLEGGFDEGSADGETFLVEEGAESGEEEGSPKPQELKEVDFFLERGMRDEAVGVLRKLAQSYGSHPEIVTRMKVAVALTPGDARASAASIAQSGPSASAGPFDDTAADHEEFEISLDEGEEDSAGAAAPAAQGAGPAPKPGAPQELSDFADLAAEIDAALMGASEKEEALLAGVEATPEGHSLVEIVAAFKKGIEQQVDADDYDTHYNLGIAYKEMGLMDEAIGEFQFAAKDQRLLVDCCSMLGICFREKGMATLAVKWYRRGLDAASTRDEETMLGLRYDLAELLVDMGEHREAMDLFTEVFGINSQYRDVAARIKDLERQLAR